MASVSPPKPWERAKAASGAAGGRYLSDVLPAPVLPSTRLPASTSAFTPHSTLNLTLNPPSTSSSVATIASTSTSTSTPPPVLPQRPASLGSVVDRNAANLAAVPGAAQSTAHRAPYAAGMAGLGAGGLGAGGLGGYGAYSGMGGMGGLGAQGAGYGGYGGYGGYSSYGGYGGHGLGSGYGYSRFGNGLAGGMYGMQHPMGMGPGQPDPSQSLSQSFSQSTAATFQLLESVIGAVGGFAQMLESSYVATHSSFFAMVAVAEQFGTLRHSLLSLLNIFSLLRWLKRLFARLTGRPAPAAGASSKELTPASFADFAGQGSAALTAAPTSRKPIIVFLLAVFGLPYLMGKLIRALANQQQQSIMPGAMSGPMPGAMSGPMYPEQLQRQDGPIDPSKLEFCRLRFSFPPPDQPPVEGVDLAVQQGDPVAVLAKTDPSGRPSDWWFCRTRDGRKGYLPSPYLEPIPAAPTTATVAATTTTHSRAQTLSSDTSGPASATPSLSTDKESVSTGQTAVSADETSRAVPRRKDAP